MHVPFGRLHASAVEQRKWIKCHQAADGIGKPLRLLWMENKNSSSSHFQKPEK